MNYRTVLGTVASALVFAACGADDEHAVAGGADGGDASAGSGGAIGGRGNGGASTGGAGTGGASTGGASTGGAGTGGNSTGGAGTGGAGTGGVGAGGAGTGGVVEDGGDASTPDAGDGATPDAGGGETGSDSSIEAGPPAPHATVSSIGLVTSNGNLSIRFDHTMRTASLVLGGDLGASAAATWSRTALDDDTVTVQGTGWPLGVDKTLVVDAVDTNGVPLATLTLVVDVVGGLFYVNDDAPDDTGNGTTPASAKKTIGAAISAASAPVAVLVAEGDYLVAPGGPPVTVEDGKSLYGGFSNDFGDRDPRAHRSIIRETSTHANGTTVAVEVGSGVTSATVLDGLFIQGGNDDATVNRQNAIGLDLGGSPIVKNCYIAGGVGAGSGGSGSNLVAVAVGGGATPMIRNNVLYGGSGDRTSGISILSANPTVINNTIHGGRNGTFAMALMVFGSTATIANNTIDGGNSAYAYGIYSASDGHATIENNIIFTSAGTYGRICVGVGNSTGQPSSLRNNLLFDCPSAIYNGDGVTAGHVCSFNAGMSCFTSIDDVNDYTNTTQDSTKPSSGNVSMTTSFVDVDGQDNDVTTMIDNDWRLPSGGTTPCALSQGALVLGSVTRDFLGNPRPGSDGKTSIGAYEMDGACTP